jgi:hypothetical protein
MTGLDLLELGATGKRRRGCNGASSAGEGVLTAAGQQAKRQMLF